MTTVILIIGYIFLGRALEILSDRLHDPGHTYIKRSKNPVKVKILRRHTEDDTLVLTRSSHYQCYQYLQDGETFSRTQ
jgi:hypothetical protein